MIEGLVPKGLSIVQLPSPCNLDGDVLVVHPKALGPFESKTFKLLMRPEKAGFFSFCPQISYIDDRDIKKMYSVAFYAERKRASCKAGYGKACASFKMKQSVAYLIIW